MAAFAGDDAFYFDDFSDDGEFRHDPFDGDAVEEFCVSGFSFPDDGNDGEEFRVPGFAFSDGDEHLVVVDHASQASHEDPILETLGRSSDSDEGLGMFLPQLVSAISSTLDLAEDISEEEVAADGGDAEESILRGLDREPGLVIEEVADDHGDDLFGFMPSGFDLGPGPVTGGFQTLVDADEGGDVVAGDDEMAEEADFDFRHPAFRMLVEDIDPDNTLDAFMLLQLQDGEVEARSLRLPASRAFVETLPEVTPTEEEASSACAVCKDAIAAGQLVVRLPCKHFFHGDCVRPWLAIRNTCPVCRHELPTGDPEYDQQLLGAFPVQHVATAQSGGVGGGATVGSEDATECAAEESRLEQSAS